MAPNHKVVSHNEWIEARKKLLAKEKEFTRLRDQLSRAAPRAALGAGRQGVRVRGPERQADAGRPVRRQEPAGRLSLHVRPRDWDAGCPHCSFWADNFNGIIVHLNHRDVTMVAVSRAPLCQARRLSRSAWAGASSGFRRPAPTSTSTTMSRSRRTRWRRRQGLQLSGRKRGTRSGGHQRVLQGRDGRDLPHLLDLRARPRHAERRLPLPRPACRRVATKAAAASVLGAPPRRVRSLKTVLASPRAASSRSRGSIFSPAPECRRWIWAAAR